VVELTATEGVASVGVVANRVRVAAARSAGGVEAISRTGSSTAGALLGHVAITRVTAAFRATGDEHVCRARVVGAIAVIGDVANAGHRATHRARVFLRVHRTGVATIAGFDRIAHARSRATHGARSDGCVRGASITATSALLRYVATSSDGRAAFRAGGLLDIGRAIVADTITVLHLIADTGGTTALCGALGI
jgi:hypothetical protein